MSSAQNSGDSQAAAVARLADANLFRIKSEGFYIFRCRCRDCELTWEFKQGNHRIPPPEIVLKKARRSGWLVDFGRKPRCPKHAVEPRRYSTITLTVPPAAPVHRPLQESPPMTAAAPIPQPSMKLVRQVMAVLEENFDETIRRYRTGWSDERISTETGVALVQVAKVRVEAFGELADDPQISALRDALAEHELQAEEYLKNAKALSAKLESFIAARKIGG